MFGSHCNVWFPMLCFQAVSRCLVPSAIIGSQCSVFKWFSALIVENPKDKHDPQRLSDGNTSHKITTPDVCSTKFPGHRKVPSSVLAKRNVLNARNDLYSQIESGTHATALQGQHSLPCVLWKAKEAKHSHTNIFECTRCPAAHSYTPTLIIPPKHNNWPPICDAKAPMTAFGQHSMAPPFNANRAKVAPRARTARTAHFSRRVTYQCTAKLF